ncbi:MAG: hypothetical protein HEQ22_07685 [Sphingopyxis sp.]|uniref:bleomycin resistance protein n=1 Tax=Sphingopyxis sp. TaxID=1908224 RepID=UPI003D81039D
MADHATPNLPSRNYDATAEFYARLGFECGWRDDGWMILRRGGATLEFFRYDDLDPTQSSFGCCLRLDDLAAFVAQVGDAGVPVARQGYPRLHQPKVEASGLNIAYLVDLDGSLIRIIQNQDAAR